MTDLQDYNYCTLCCKSNKLIGRLTAAAFGWAEMVEHFLHSEVSILTCLGCDCFTDVEVLILVCILTVL